MQRDDQPEPRIFDPDSPEQREMVAASAYERSLEVAAARDREQEERPDEAYYALSWRHLPRERQDPFRAAVDALVSIIDFGNDER